MREPATHLSPEELERTCHDIQKGLNRMLEFEEKLHHFDKETLCLLLTLMVDPKNYGRVLHLLENLAPLNRE